MDAKVVFVILTFSISVLGMLAFVIALIQKQVLVPTSAARSIFGDDELGHSEPDGKSRMSDQWRLLVQSAKTPNQVKQATASKTAPWNGESELNAQKWD